MHSHFEFPEFELDRLQLTVQISRLGPKATQPAAGNAPQAGETPGGQLQSAKVPPLLACGPRLPAMLARVGAVTADDVIESKDKTPQVLALG